MASSFACPRPSTIRFTPGFQCTLQVEDLEIYVREWEKTVQRGADQATWFEEYVSGTENSGPFAYAEHVEYTTSRLPWGWGGGGGYELNF